MNCMLAVLFMVLVAVSAQRGRFRGGGEGVHAGESLGVQEDVAKGAKLQAEDRALDRKEARLARKAARQAVSSFRLYGF